MDALRTIGRSVARLGRHDIHFYVARPTLYIYYTFSTSRAASNEERRCRNNTRSLAARFTSTNVQTPAFGNAQSYFAGKNSRTSTKEESLSKAKEIAEDWYRQLRGKLRAGEIRNEKTFREVSDHRSGKATVLMYRQDRWEHYDFNDIQP
jgi:hypothetical protein